MEFSDLIVQFLPLEGPENRTPQDRDTGDELVVLHLWLLAMLDHDDVEPVTHIARHLACLREQFWRAGLVVSKLSQKYQEPSLPQERTHRRHLPSMSVQHILGSH